mgnify:CR=1 FL=1
MPRDIELERRLIRTKGPPTKVDQIHESLKAQGFTSWDTYPDRPMAEGVAKDLSTPQGSVYTPPTLTEARVVDLGPEAGRLRYAIYVRPRTPHPTPIPPLKIPISRTLELVLPVPTPKTSPRETLDLIAEAENDEGKTAGTEYPKILAAVRGLGHIEHTSVIEGIIADERRHQHEFRRIFDEILRKHPDEYARRFKLLFK